jgi:hypothetical protein
MKLFAQTIDSSEFTTTELTTTDLTTSSSADAAAGVGAGLMLLYLAILVFLLVCIAKIYTKAGRKWWEAIVPIYNIYVFQKIVGRPGWWVLLYFIPFVNFVVAIVNGVDLAKAFGRGLGTGLAYVFLPVIMAPIMAFSSSYQYKRGSSSSNMGSGGPAGSPSKSQGFEGQAVTSVPAAGAAVGGGVGAAQPGEAISQTNPVPKDGPVNSPVDTPEVPASETQKPEEPASESLEQPASSPVEQPAEEPQPEQPEPSDEQTAPGEPTSPPENPLVEDPNDPQNPGAGTTLG